MDTLNMLNISPMIVVDGYEILGESFIKYNGVFGNSSILIVKQDILEKFYNCIFKYFKEENILEFNGECSLGEINRIKDILKLKSPSSVVVMGGGKVLDTGKVVAYDLGLPVITIPTSAATGAASSALSAIYSNDGKSVGYRVFDKSTDLIILDYALILDSPIQQLVFGIADSLAKYYESFAFTNGFSNNIFTSVALNLSKDIKKYLFDFVSKALIDFKNNNLTDELKNIIKINIVLAPMVGGIGGEGCRACISHAVNNSFTQLDKMVGFLHGEVVAFGNLIQLYLDRRQGSKDELESLLFFYKQIGLMQDFLYFNVDLDEAEKRIFLDYILDKKETLRNMPRKIEKEELVSCLKYFKVF